MGNSSGSEKKPTNSENSNFYYTQDTNFGKDSDGLGNANIEQVLEGRRKKLENPGPVEDVHKDCREVMPNFCEGARLILNKCLSNYFQLSHTIKLLPNSAESCYRFGATYVGSQRHGVFESYPVLFGEIERSGSMQASIVHCLTDHIRMKFGAEYQGSQLIGGQLVTDYVGDTFTASMGIANPNIIKSSGIFVGQYLQSVTRNLALGSELGCQYGLLYPQGMITVFNFISKYRGDSSIFSTSIGGSGIHLSYVKEASPQLKVGVEFNTNFDAQSTYTTLGYQVNVPKANLSFRASMDTNWNICSVLEKKLKPLPFSFSLSALLNQKTGKFKMGCGLMIG